MTARPRKRCTRPYCPRPAHYPSPLCSEHRAAHDATYQRHRDVYEDPAWIALSRRVLDTRPVCEGCHRARSAHAHHVIALAMGGKALDPVNVVALCIRCHGRETARELQLGHAVTAKPRPPTPSTNAPAARRRGDRGRPRR